MIKGKVHHVSNTINKLTSTITMSLYFTTRYLHIAKSGALEVGLRH